MSAFRLFQVHGVEIEYMIVDARTLDVRPIADRLLEAAAGKITGDVVLDGVTWSNELALHVVELKVDPPVPTLHGIGPLFQQHVGRMQALLAPLGARLLPGGMHPWMQPDREFRLWPHEYSAVYAAFDRIFGCTGHGWSNLQSAHLNLPFSGDEEFGRLHAAVRLVLPLIPALSAASPVMDGRVTGLLDTRLEVYRANSRRVPLMAGRVIPEPAFTRREYEEMILRPLYRQIAPLDPEGVLREEWLNARGAIARFERDAIEVRVVDAQECPRADLAVAGLVTALLRALVEERWSRLADQQAVDVARLEPIFLRALERADEAPVGDADYLALFGAGHPAASTAGDLWRRLFDEIAPSRAGAEADWEADAGQLLRHGPLARRLVTALGLAPSRSRLEAVWRGLADCLAGGRFFLP